MARHTRNEPIVLAMAGIGPTQDRVSALMVLGLQRAGSQACCPLTESGRVEVRQGKGRKDRVCWLPPSALPAVRDWLAVRGAAPGPLLLPVRKGGRIEDRALSAQAVRDLCRDLARLAATEPFTLHDLRRTWTGDLLDASGDLAIVQQLAGHASPATTLRYDRRPEATRPRAAELLHVPYVAPHPHPMPAAPAGRVPRLLRERRCVAVSVRRYERSSRAEERGR